MKRDTGWKRVGKWYDELVSKNGHAYHERVIFPALKKWYAFKKTDAVLDLGCGQGILARQLPPGIDYLGIDASQPLIRRGKKYSKHRFMVADVTEPLHLEQRNFSHVFIILALQNMQRGERAILNGADHLRRRGKLILVLNHPCFRIARQSSWGVDQGKNLQYRRLDRYRSPMEIPIRIRPSRKEESEKTFSYHHPLSAYAEWMVRAGLSITRLEEWHCHKSSTGKRATMENRAREEFPLFLALEGTIR
ncbi:MAG: class I SAM-dependent methyltransferase [Chlamydiota bacterium]